LASIAVSCELLSLEYILDEVAKGFMIPTFILFLRSNHAKPEAMVVFPIPVSVPVTNTPCNFLLDRDVFFFVNKT
jgi:hypothetical protein